MLFGIYLYVCVSHFQEVKEGPPFPGNCSYGFLVGPNYSDMRLSVTLARQAGVSRRLRYVLPRRSGGAGGDTSRFSTCDTLLISLSRREIIENEWSLVVLCEGAIRISHDGATSRRSLATPEAASETPS